MTTRFPLSFSSVVATGFAIFSMFFGAGNLLFPIELGQRTGSNIWYGYIGLFTTGVVFALAGLVAIALFDGKHSTFFNRLGKRSGFTLELMILLVVGPLTGVPRSIDVLYELAHAYIPALTLTNFVICFMLIIFTSTYKRERIMPLLGYVISPLLVTLLFITIGIGLTNINDFITTAYTPFQAFQRGIREGYITMDMLAAFHFAPLAVIYLRRMSTNARMGIKNVTRSTIAAIAITGGLLATIYAGLSFIGAHKFGLQGIHNPATLTMAIASRILPSWMLLPLCLLVFLAITSTAISLTTISADFLREDIFSERISHGQALWMTIITTGLAAHGGLHLMLIIEKLFVSIAYPPLIVLTVCNILYKTTGFRHVKGPFWTAFALSLGYYFLA